VADAAAIADSARFTTRRQTRAISLYLFITSLDTVLNIASLASDRVSVGGEPQVPGIRYPSMINGLSVATAPA